MDAVDCIEALEPGKQPIVEVDDPAGHARYEGDSLNVNGVNVMHRGKRKVLPDSITTERCRCLGPRDAEMYRSNCKWSTILTRGVTTQIVDTKPRLDEVQHMLFDPGDPRPFYDWSAPPGDVVGIKAPDRRDKGERPSRRAPGSADEGAKDMNRGGAVREGHRQNPRIWGNPQGSADDSLPGRRRRRRFRLN